MLGGRVLRRVRGDDRILQRDSPCAVQTGVILGGVAGDRAVEHRNRAAGRVNSAADLFRRITVDQDVREVKFAAVHDNGAAARGVAAR